MAVMPIRKVVGAPGAPTAPNELVAVRVGAGFDLHMADSDGSALVPLNQPDGIPEGAMLVIGAADDIPAGWYPVSTFTAGAVELRVISRTAPQRVTVPLADPIGISGHSLLATMSGFTTEVDPIHGGIFRDIWTGDVHETYMGGSWIRERWAANGPERTATAYGALIITEMGVLDPEDPAPGYADPASEQGIETLQYLYWYALTAQSKGSVLMAIYPAWAAQGLGPEWDDDLMAKAVYWQSWLNAWPEIAIPVFVIPTPYFIRQAISLSAIHHPGWNIYIDDIHLNSSWQEVDEGLSWLCWMFLRGQQAPADGGRSPMLQALIDMGWDLLTTWECTGLGTAPIAPFPVASDPLPSPDPLPGGGPTVPAQPAAPSVSSITAGGATISWTAPADGGSAITGYTLDWRPVGGGSTPVTGATSPHGLTGLDPETGYEVRVTAINAVGAGTPSSWTGFETGAEAGGEPSEAIVEITPTSYAGPAPSVALPAASGGYRTISNQVSGGYGHSGTFDTPIAGEVYAILAVRRDGGFSDVLELLSLGGGPASGRTFPIITAIAFGYGGNYQAGFNSDGDETGFGLGDLDAGWHIIEMWAAGGAFSVAIDGGTPQSGSNAMTSWSLTHFGLRMAHAGGATSYDLAGLRILDAIPDATGRVAQRSWAEGLMPS